MTRNDLYTRYQELQRYVGWTDHAAQRVAAVAGLVAPHLPALVDDFYDEIDRHPDARKVITGGTEQVERLKGTLRAWLSELFTGRYDSDYVWRRWRVGGRHVEIGLDQVYTNAALSRLRAGLKSKLRQNWMENQDELTATFQALDLLLDLDLAIIEDAYQSAFTERQQRSEQLIAQQRLAQVRARSEAAFAALVEAAPCLIVILRPNNRVAYVNRLAEDLTGHPESAVIGQEFASIFLPTERHLVARDAIRGVLQGVPFRSVEGVVLCRDGSRRWFLWNASPLADHEGEPAVLLVGQDITALKQAQDRNLQAERLAAIGQMVAGLAHESGNALARSQTSLELLALEVQQRPESLQLVERIQKAQDHLQQLYDEVKTYAAPIRLETEPIRLDRIWRQAWNNLAVRRQGRDARLIEPSEGVDLQCKADLFRLEQVFRNILDNALAACSEPVEVTVTASEAILEERPALLIRIRDNGPGLNAEQRRRIFEPFFTTRTRGTGLGMAIVRRIVEAHGGRIAVGAGPGAEILLTLPRTSD